MKVVSFHNMVFTFNSKGKWTGPDSTLTKILNQESDFVRKDYSPSQGHPRQVVFDRIVDLFKAKVLNDDEKFDAVEGAEH